MRLGDVFDDMEKANEEMGAWKEGWRDQEAIRELEKRLFFQFNVRQRYIVIDRQSLPVVITIFTRHPSYIRTHF